MYSLIPKLTANSCPEQKRKCVGGLLLCFSASMFAFSSFLHFYFSNCGPSGFTSLKIYSGADWRPDLGSWGLITTVQVNLRGEALCLLWLPDVETKSTKPKLFVTEHAEGWSERTVL